VRSTAPQRTGGVTRLPVAALGRPGGGRPRKALRRQQADAWRLPARHPSTSLESALEPAVGSSTPLVPCVHSGPSIIHHSSFVPFVHSGPMHCLRCLVVSPPPSVAIGCFPQWPDCVTNIRKQTYGLRPVSSRWEFALVRRHKLLRGTCPFFSRPPAMCQRVSPLCKAAEQTRRRLQDARPPPRHT